MKSNRFEVSLPWQRTQQGFSEPLFEAGPRNSNILHLSRTGYRRLRSCISLLNPCYISIPGMCILISTVTRPEAASIALSPLLSQWGLFIQEPGSTNYLPVIKTWILLFIWIKATNSGWNFQNFRWTRLVHDKMAEERRNIVEGMAHGGWGSRISFLRPAWTQGILSHGGLHRKGLLQLLMLLLLLPPTVITASQRLMAQNGIRSSNFKLIVYLLILQMQACVLEELRAQPACPCFSAPELE